MNKGGLSVFEQGIRYKLKIALYLMAVLPLLVCLYIVSTFVFPRVGLRTDVLLILGVSFVVTAAGFFILKGIFDRIVTISTDAKLIAAGDARHLQVGRHKDEVEDLGEALNRLSSRIHGNMQELKDYSEKTAELNIEIQKRVAVLSSLLNVSSLIAQGSKLELLLQAITEKARMLATSDIAYLFVRSANETSFEMRHIDGFSSPALQHLRISEDDPLFRKLIAAREALLLDSGSMADSRLVSELAQRFNIKNTLALPVALRGTVVAILGVGNSRPQFIYKKDDLELLDIFGKQVAIALENELLSSRVEKLEIKDPLTDLFNEAYILSRLQEEIRRAIVYQRPCGFVILDVDNFNVLRDKVGQMQAEAELKRVGSLIKDSVREIDRVGRITENGFAIIIPERNKRQTLETAEEIRKKVAFVFSENPDPQLRLTLSGGVSENPLDGITSDELVVKAKTSLNLAKAQGKNRVLG